MFLLCAKACLCVIGILRDLFSKSTTAYAHCTIIFLSSVCIEAVYSGSKSFYPLILCDIKPVQCILHVWMLHDC